MIERSLVLVKHDGVVRGLIGEIIKRLENVGLKICAMKMMWADEKLAENHYKFEKEWATNVFNKTKETHERDGTPFPYSDPLEFGKMVQGWNIDFLREGPVIAFVVEGPHAIPVVRRLIGHTEPKQADIGTIRGDYAMTESYDLANNLKRVTRNLVHASDSVKNAEREIFLWFSKEEIHNYSKELDRHY